MTIADNIQEKLQARLLEDPIAQKLWTELRLAEACLQAGATTGTATPRERLIEHEAREAYYARVASVKEAMRLEYLESRRLEPITPEELDAIELGASEAKPVAYRQLRLCAAVRAAWLERDAALAATQPTPEDVCEWLVESGLVAEATYNAEAHAFEVVDINFRELYVDLMDRTNKIAAHRDALLRVASGDVAHVNFGKCPGNQIDHFGEVLNLGPSARDLGCPACAAMDADHGT